MAIKFFSVSVLNGESAESELNGFLRSHKVLNVERHWVDQGANSFWSFCIDYLDRAATTSSGQRPPGQRGKVDYREVLSAGDFAVFAKLRELRKAVAQSWQFRRAVLQRLPVSDHRPRTG